MAKNGLELGNRVEIFSKKYRILNDLLLNPKEVLGACKFVKNEGAQFVNVDLEKQTSRENLVSCALISLICVSVKSTCSVM